MPNEEDGILSKITDYAAHPFKADMDLLNWFLFVGLILVFVFLWSRVVRAAAEIA
jgi:hypothetical protein